MVALMIPQPIADEIAVPGGELPEKLHVTIAYIPGLAGDEEKIVRLQQCLSPLSQTLAPIQGKIGGTGRFNGSPQSDGKDVYYASFNSPGLEALRRAVLDAIEKAGLSASNVHGFVPHITLKYISPKEALPKKLNGTLPFAIDKLTIGENDNYTDFQMVGTVVLKGSPTGSSVHVESPDWSVKLVKISLDAVEKDKLSSKQRNDLGDKTFALPDERKYPIPDSSHARNALARVAQYGTDDEKEKVRAAVYRKFPELKKSVEKDTPKVLEGGGLDGQDEGSNAMDGIYSMAQIVSGIDWELGDGGLSDTDDAKLRALDNLSSDPDFYRKKYVMKDTEQADEDQDLGVGINLDLGSGQSRQKGFLGVDLYPMDFGTIVDDMELGLPYIDDETCENVRMSNVPDVDPKKVMSTVQRVLMSGGMFSYEGPQEITSFPPHMEEVDKEQIDKLAGGPWTKQTFRKMVVPDPATSNDAEPRVSIHQHDMLPADSLLAIDAVNYDEDDDSTSGLGNKIHGYPSQGALMAKKVRRLGVDNTGAVSKESPIFKMDRWKQIIYCVVLSPNETDLQDDIMSAEDIEETAHNYLIDARVVGASHRSKMDADVVESYIAPHDFNADGQFGKQLVKKGAWVIGIKVQDPREWQKVLSGEYTGVSVGGVGSRIPI